MFHVKHYNSLRFLNIVDMRYAIKHIFGKECFI